MGPMLLDLLRYQSSRFWSRSYPGWAGCWLFYSYFLSKINKTLFASISSPLTETGKSKHVLCLQGYIASLPREDESHEGPQGRSKPPPPRAALVTLDKAQSPGQGPCMWPMQDEGQESGPIRPRDVKSNRSYAKGPVPGFYRVQEPGGYLLKINK